MWILCSLYLLSPLDAFYLFHHLSQGIMHHIRHNAATSRQLKFRMAVCEKHLALYNVILLLTCAQCVSCGDSGNPELKSNHSQVTNINFLRRTQWVRKFVWFGTEDAQRSFSGPKVQRWWSDHLNIQRLWNLEQSATVGRFPLQKWLGLPVDLWWVAMSWRGCEFVYLRGGTKPTLMI